MARVLVIDDESDIRGLLHSVLGRKGHEVLLAEGGRQGIALFRETRPMVTILDLCMPDMDGIEVLEHIRSHDLHAVVIVLTGWDSEENKTKARQLGVRDCLKKGNSLSELGDALRRVMVERSRMPVREEAKRCGV